MQPYIASSNDALVWMGVVWGVVLVVIILANSFGGRDAAKTSGDISIRPDKKAGLFERCERAWLRRPYFYAVYVCPHGKAAYERYEGDWTDAHMRDHNWLPGAHTRKICAECDEITAKYVAEARMTYPEPETSFLQIRAIVAGKESIAIREIEAMPTGLSKDSGLLALNAIAEKLDIKVTMSEITGGDWENP